MTLLDAWAPSFAVSLGISREQMEGLSIPGLVDHLDYFNETHGGQHGRD